jgi:hypothetical protein
MVEVEMAGDKSAETLAAKLGASYAAAQAKAPGPRTTGNSVSAVNTTPGTSYSVTHSPRPPSDTL